MPKRKAAQIEELGHEAEGGLRRSARIKPSSAPVLQNTSTTAETTNNRTKSSPTKNIVAGTTTEKTEPVRAKATSKATTGKAKATAKQLKGSRPAGDDVSSSSSADRQYWLMKAEPESRFENGVDVRFSIDDLAAKTEPEPWDGIRAYAARNNLRSMKKGDLAFFYHSNCKEPGIVGTMEIVEEHSPDLSAHDPKAPYYDASSTSDNPKWSVVHVKFRSKFAVPIGLKELKGMGKPLENMQMLKQSRLSVSKVSASEWQHLMAVAEQKAKETAV